jgi:hypothetical protein
MAIEYELRVIPERYRAKCEFCPDPIDIRDEGVHQWTAGWVMQRAGGGGHGISCAVRENRWAHKKCVERESRGLPQQSLFG